MFTPKNCQKFSTSLDEKLSDDLEILKFLISETCYKIHLTKSARMFFWKTFHLG